MYGTFVFNIDVSRAGRGGTRLRFVLDESGETPPDETIPAKKSRPEDKQKQNAAAKKPAASEKPTVQPLLENAKRSRYDRMYIDLNHDGDLTNDGVFRPMKSPPWQALPSWWGPDEKMAFDFLDLDVDYGPGVGVRPFRVLPWLTLSGSGKKLSATMHFVAATAREGRIRIGSHADDALLSQSGLLSGRWDHPWTGLRLKPVDPIDKLLYGGFAGDSMMSAHRVDGKIFTTRATPLGDKLIVEPYRGDFGVFSLGPGVGRSRKWPFAAR